MPILLEMRRGVAAAVRAGHFAAVKIRKTREFRCGFGLTTILFQPIRFSSGETAASTVSGHRGDAAGFACGLLLSKHSRAECRRTIQGRDSMSRTTESRKGFTLVELAVVIVIIGVLAAFGVPQFLKSVERSKAAEAFNYLSAVRSAQERYLAKEGLYADSATSTSSGHHSGSAEVLHRRRPHAGQRLRLPRRVGN